MHKLLIKINKKEICAFIISIENKNVNRRKHNDRKERTVC